MSRFLNRSWLSAIGAVVGLSLLTGGQAQAFYTPIVVPATPQATQLDVLNHVYGAGWAADGVNYENVALGRYVERVADALDVNGTAGAMIGVGSGNMAGVTDQVWHDGFVTAIAKARFAAFPQNFGYVLAGDPVSNYVQLFSESGGGYNITGSVILTDLSGQVWRWARTGGASHPTLFQTSLESDNLDQPAYTAAAFQDHLVTYKLTGMPNQKGPIWLLFWEDLNRGVQGDATSDRDFNDLMVEVQALYVPLPSAAWSGMAMLLGLGLVGAGRRFGAAS